MISPQSPHRAAIISDAHKMLDAVLISLTLILACWIPFLMDTYLGYHLKNYGLKPRTLEGVRGIFTIHFLHGDWKHIGQNSLGLLVLNSFVFYFYRSIARKVFLWIFLLAPFVLWIIGRPSNHIGASVLLYGEFAFLVFSGIIRKNPLLMRVTFTVIFFYGSLVWYLFPIDAKVSWEGHGSGFFIGLILAFVYRKQGPQPKIYRFETEPELPDDENAYWKVTEEKTETQEQIIPQKQNEEDNHTSSSPTTITIRYHYKKENENTD